MNKNIGIKIGNLSMDNALVVLEAGESSINEILNYVSASDKLNDSPAIRVLLKNAIIKLESLKDIVKGSIDYTKKCMELDRITPKQHYFDIILDGKRENGVRAASQDELKKIYEMCDNRCVILREYDENKKLLKQYEEPPKEELKFYPVSKEDSGAYKIPSEFVKNAAFIEKSIKKNNAIIKDQMENGIVKADLSGIVSEKGWQEEYDKIRGDMFPDDEIDSIAPKKPKKGRSKKVNDTRKKTASASSKAKKVEKSKTENGEAK